MPLKIGFLQEDEDQSEQEQDWETGFNTLEEALEKCFFDMDDGDITSICTYPNDKCPGRELDAGECKNCREVVKHPGISSHEWIRLATAKG